MGMRKDAGMAAIKLGAAIDTVFTQCCGVNSVWTFGELKFVPGSHSIIPGKAVLCLQYRDASREVLERMTRELKQVVQRANTGPVSVTMHVDPRQNVDGVACDSTLQQHMAAAANKHAPGQWVRMPSGAAHDAQVIAGVLPVGMLFVPSIRGVSHNFEENTSDEDIVLGCQVLLDTVVSVATNGTNTAKL